MPFNGDGVPSFLEVFGEELSGVRHNENYNRRIVQQICCYLVLKVINCGYIACICWLLVVFGLRYFTTHRRDRKCSRSLYQRLSPGTVICIIGYSTELSP